MSNARQQYAIFQFSWWSLGQWPLFGTLQGPISAKCLVTDSPD